MVYIWIGIGGVMGALLRYSVSVVMDHGAAGGFPFATLFVNCLGCFLLPFLTEKVKGRIPVPIQKAITAGVIGSFTTFSAFSVEVITLIEAGRAASALLYIGSSIGGGLLFVRLGRKGAKAV
ncbi:fluoride efflux transporter CrcB [Domibacillus sp. DTU_2020_1001157_1_SI_ALB_TIR_016]|uniref:fluoride efflux transporter CrcB n=1 Tax=Domibacillus sp. DTU_2020_1001157_1_SI_ALB_TIR_016 TaxID=3077789 RepID=UPI0028F0171D|nr:fluoride efflux transporter CrcB [Domibacillus sp. DTU_2020_1001157_1_SI_ALB_TIR_016]WNS80471.1 fluoride efflux transporter CrcB [Domibacillus sp. DTU_2020_1001157_1_SI_ALB_TIR_016]